ncbi:MAG: ammonium transporter [Novosphingobium sp.]|nr:ammonium transporter [Novosphingobium sp.]
MKKFIAVALAASAALLPVLAQAQAVEAIDAADSGDTAWLLASSVLVMLMTLPGLTLFYGGRVRAGGVLSVAIQIGAIAAVTSLLWIVVGYTLAFGPVSNGWIGGGSAWMLAELGNVRDGTLVPESAYALFQMTLAVFAPALMVGAWVDRARFGWVVGFAALWSLIVYAPVAHWIWGNGWLASRLGTMDFAGGIVVHTAAGVSALVAALLLGKRSGFPDTDMPPHSPALAMIGAGLLWAGWLGLAGGAALTATDDTAVAIINTHAAACAAALAWLVIEKISTGKPTALGFAKGLVAGLVTVAPAAGFIAPGAAILFGLAACAVCYPVMVLVKHRIAIDDSLDVFAISGIGGMTGSLLLALFLEPSLGGIGYNEGMGLARQLFAQAAGVGVVAAWSAIGTVICALAVAMVIPMRVTEDEEREGLDAASHGEQAWDFA